MSTEARLKHGRGAQIDSDLKTVWINSGVDGASIGRFSTLGGIDIHKPAMEQLEGGTQCLQCSTDPHWKSFVNGMSEHYGIDADELEKHKPEGV